MESLDFIYKEELKRRELIKQKKLYDEIENLNIKTKIIMLNNKLKPYLNEMDFCDIYNINSNLYGLEQIIKRHEEEDTYETDYSNAIMYLKKLLEYLHKYEMINLC